MVGKPMLKSGHCAHSSGEESHSWCRVASCDCECHKIYQPYGGRGIMYVIMADREQLRKGQSGTIEVLADAIDEAIDKGFDDSESIARYLTTSAFKHIRNRGIRYNSIVQASDATGAHISSKLYSAYDDLMTLWEEEGSTDEILEAQADGIACALSIVFHPFDVESVDNPREVDWDQVDRWADSLRRSEESRRKVSRYLNDSRKKKRK